jgi:hypothetical protein
VGGGLDILMQAYPDDGMDEQGLHLVVPLEVAEPVMELRENLVAHGTELATVMEEIAPRIGIVPTTNDSEITVKLPILPTEVLVSAPHEPLVVESDALKFV